MKSDPDSQGHSYFRISRVCSACGKPSERVRKDIIVNYPYSITYVLCEQCEELRKNKWGSDLFPIDGTQPCFYCGKSARHVSHNPDVFQTARQQRSHYTCDSCQALAEAAFKKTLAQLSHHKPRSATFPVELIVQMDEEVRAAAAPQS